MEVETGHIRLWTKDFIFVLLANTSFYTASYIIIATIGQHFDVLNAPSVYISLSIATLSGGAFIMRFIAGNLLDIIGRRKMIYIGGFLLLMCYVAYIYTSLNGTVFVRALNGLSWGIVGTAMATVCTDVTHKERRGDGLGIFAVSSVFCMAFSPMIAIPIYNNWGFNTILLFSVGLQILGLICLTIIKIPKVSLRKPTKGHSFININDMIEKRAAFPALINLLVSISMCGIISFIIIHGTNLGIKSIWVYFIGHLGAVMLARTFAETVSAKKGIMYVILPGLLLMTTGMLILWGAKTLPLIILASVFFGLGYGATYPTLQAWALNRSPEDRRGAANGMFLSAMDLAAIFGAFVLTEVMDILGTAEIYLLSAIFLIISAVIVTVKGKAISEEDRKTKFKKDLDLADKVNE